MNRTSIVLVATLALVPVIDQVMQRLHEGQGAGT